MTEKLFCIVYNVLVWDDPGADSSGNYSQYGAAAVYLDGLDLRAKVLEHSLYRYRPTDWLYGQAEKNKVPLYPANQQVLAGGWICNVKYGKEIPVIVREFLKKDFPRPEKSRSPYVRD